MDSRPQPERLGKDSAADLKAAMEARRELGSDLEDAVLESFLARVQQRIDAQVDQRLAQSGSRPVMRDPDRPVRDAPHHSSSGRGHVPWLVIPASMAVAIPLVEKMHGNGFAVVLVMIAVIVVIVMTFVDRWVDL